MDKKNKTEKRGGARSGAGRQKINKMEKKHPVTLHVQLKVIDNPELMTDSEKVELLTKQLRLTKAKMILKKIL